MAEFNNLYQQAIYYDVVFKRDVSPEVEFVAAVYEQHNGKAPTSLLDLACGPGYHARAFAKRGGRAIGLDLREEMLAFAADSAAEEGVNVEWIAADMRYLKLDAPVDIALNVFDGIDCLNTNDDLIDHLRAIGDNLTPGGLYFIDVTHPRHTIFGNYEHFAYHGERDGIQVDIRWGVNNPDVDGLTHIACTELEMHVNDNGREIKTKDVAMERVLTAQEIILLAKLAGNLSPVGWWGDYDFNVPFGPDTPRMISILQKR